MALFNKCLMSEDAMFDAITVRHGGDTHNHTHHVTEKRAPTDDSVRLLREMENSAKEEVLKSIRLPSNEFSGVAHLMRDYLSCSTNVAVLFKLNGKDHKVLISFDDFMDDNIDKRIEKMVCEVSNYLARNILESTLNSSEVKELFSYRSDI